MQRISDTWHATIGSTAISLIDYVFKNSNDEFTTDNEHQVFAKEQLEEHSFIYGDTKSKVRMLFIFESQLTTQPPSSPFATFFVETSFSTLSQHTTAPLKVLSRFLL